MNRRPGQNGYQNAVRTPGRGALAYKVVPKNRCYICEQCFTVSPTSDHIRLDFICDGFYLFDRKIMAHRHRVCPDRKPPRSPESVPTP